MQRSNFKIIRDPKEMQRIWKEQGIQAALLFYQDMLEDDDSKEGKEFALEFTEEAFNIQERFGISLEELIKQKQIKAPDEFVLK